MTTAAFSSLKNHFLLAMPGFTDPNFKNAVIYICEHSRDGAMGLIINHPIDATMSRVFDELKLEYPTEIGARPLLVGGPVQQQRGFVIHRPASHLWESTLYVSPDVCITASKDIIADIAGQRGPAASYITLGYAGWGAGQLENELSNNFWLVSEADSQIIFDVPFEQRAQAAATKLGVDLTRLSPQAGHA